LTIHTAKWMDEVLALALERLPEPRVADVDDTDQDVADANVESVAQKATAGINPH